MRSSWSLIAAATATLALSGCAGTPWAASHKHTAATSDTVAANRATNLQSDKTQPAEADVETLQRAMAEVREIGAIDPAAQDRLLDDLRRSDPVVWPLVIQQCRATLAYRRRLAEQNGTATASLQRPTDQVTASVAPPSATAPSRLPPTDDERPWWSKRPAVQIEPSRPGQVVSASYVASAAETKPRPADALSKPPESAPLTLRNLMFCTEVVSYGCTKRFEKYEFDANQEVLLYAEVENFASEATPKGYHTSLRIAYQIVDSRGCVAEQQFAPTEEYCQNLRHDFFIGYHLRMPRRLAPGRYTLRLSIEDLKSHKTGQASVEFAIKTAGK
ncbi:MAG: hypothetical protein ABFC63_05825 [Thermoguttaceae bacterium]